MSDDLIGLIEKRKRTESARPKVITEREKLNNLQHWATFYRRNINLYIQDRLGVRLEPYQHLQIQLMNESMIYAGTCSRGTAKSFTTALFASARCLLYPKYKVVVVASTISQGMVIYKKIQNEICGGTLKDGLSPFMSYLYRRDLIHFRISDEALEIEFKLTNSRIRVMAPIPSSKGGRANLLIFDEYRLLKRGDIESIFMPFEERRQSDFLNLEEYANNKKMMEEACSCYISSNSWKTEWAWNFTKGVITNMLNGGAVKNNFFACDIFLPMRHGRITFAQYHKWRSNMSDINFRIEVLNETMGEAEESYFKLEEFKKNQTIKKAFRTPTDQEYLLRIDMGNRGKRENEHRIMFIDFAFEKSITSEVNANTVIGVRN